MKNTLSSNSKQSRSHIARGGIFKNSALALLLLVGSGAALAMYTYSSNSLALIDVEGSPLEKVYSDCRLESFVYQPAPVLVNISSEPLTIEPFSSCGCIAVSGTSQQLPPLGRLELPITINPAQGGTLRDGVRRIEQTISIKAYSATRVQEIKLPVSIQLFEPFVIHRDERQVAIRCFQNGEAKVRLSSALATIVPLSVAAQEPFVEASLRWNEAHQDGEINLRFSDETPIGLSTANVVLTSKNSASNNKFELSIPISVTCQLPLEASIEAIVFDEAVAQHQIEFQATHSNVERFEIQSSHCSLSGVKTTVNQNIVSVVANDTRGGGEKRGHLAIRIRVYSTERGISQEYDHKVPIIVCRSFSTL